MKGLSLRTRLTIWYAAAVLAALAVCAIAVLVEQQRVGVRRVDRELESVDAALATVFEEEYLKLAHRPEFRDDLFGGVPPDPKSAHGGYFAQDKRSITPFDEKTFAKSAKDDDQSSLAAG